MDLSTDKKQPEHQKEQQADEIVLRAEEPVLLETLPRLALEELQELGAQYSGFWDEFGDEKFKKAIAITNLLRCMINPTLYLSGRQALNMTLCIDGLAKSHSLETLQDPEAGMIALLPLATYVNSCRL